MKHILRDYIYPEIKTKEIQKPTITDSYSGLSNWIE